MSEKTNDDSNRNTPALQLSGESQRSEIFKDALRYWEPRRILYNALLATVTLAWIGFTWPHFRPALKPQSLLLLLILAVLANLCYSAAYFPDLLVQLAGLHAAWRRRRWILWCAGTIFAILLANYWIADEIYPFPNP